MVNVTPPLFGGESSFFIADLSKVVRIINFVNTTKTDKAYFDGFIERSHAVFTFFITFDGDDGSAQLLTRKVSKVEHKQGNGGGTVELRRNKPSFLWLASRMS